MNLKFCKKIFYFPLVNNIYKMRNESKKTVPLHHKAVLFFIRTDKDFMIVLPFFQKRSFINNPPCTL